MYIPVVLGTARKGRESEKVAKYVVEMVKKAGVDTELIDVKDYLIGMTDRTGELPPAKKWQEKLLRSDALIIVAPEYNHSYSGELKMFLDMHYKEYFNRPVGLVGVSEWSWGGTRGLQALKLTCLALNMRPVLETVYVPMVKDQFDEAGNAKNPSLEKSVNGQIKALVAHAEALKGLIKKS